jgi:hypothetical protein
VKYAQGSHVFAFLPHNVVKLDTQQIAERGHVKETVAKLFDQYFLAMLARFTREVRGHEMTQVAVLGLSWSLLPGGFDFDAAAFGNCLSESAIDPGCGFLVFCQNIKYTAVANEVFVNRGLEVCAAFIAHP